MAVMADGSERYVAHGERFGRDSSETCTIKPVERAVSHIQHKKLVQTPSADVLRSFITTQYRTYELLTPHLENPKTLYSQLLIPLPAPLKSHLLTTYYSFDAIVVRELMGKKLSSRTRKELDDVVDKTKIPLGGCRRMFDNLKRVARKLEDCEGDMVRFIQTEFLLPREMAGQYANVIFISNYRLETNKRRLAHLQFADFSYVASIFIQYLTSPTSPPLEELDSQLSQDARDLKTVLLSPKEVVEDLKQSLTRYLTSIGKQSILQPQQQSQTGTPTQQNPLNTACKVVLRNVFSLGGILTNSRELRDIFLILQERVVEPCIALGWSSADTDVFLAAVPVVFGELAGISAQIKQRYTFSVTRLFSCVRFAAVRFHQAAEGVEVVVVPGHRNSVIERSGSLRTMTLS